MFFFFLYYAVIYSVKSHAGDQCKDRYIAIFLKICCLYIGPCGRMQATTVKVINN